MTRIVATRICTYPFFVPCAPGDQFNALLGCDKRTQSSSGQSCSDYGNLQHYRSFPFVPPPEYSI